MSTLPRKRRRFHRGRPNPSGIGESHPGSQLCGEQLDWLKAIERFRSARGRAPTWTEVLRIAYRLGYRQVA